jgi:ubiquinone/menaquinone biosynthesis C-methylase UbiE
VVGIDASADVIAEARRDHPGVSFTVGDAYRMDVPDASFDIVHAHQLLQHLADPVAALKEMRRVTAPVWKKRSCRAGSGLSLNAASRWRRQQIRTQYSARLRRHEFDSSSCCSLAAME